MRPFRSRSDGGPAWFLALAAGTGLLATGAWAFLGPSSFYRHVAEYPPYNDHFLHDIGSFLIGLGAGPLGALFIGDVLTLARVGPVKDFDAGVHLCPDHATGRTTWEEWLRAAHGGDAPT